MCGICGIVYGDRDRPADRGEIAAMTACLRHRGPDGEGLFVEPGIAFGHRRLKVIDPAGGDQPMSLPGGRLTICYNGEIYNFRALRRELEGLGATFRTGSDTEVLLWGYHHWGADLLQRLVGMFAFALWDAPRQELLLARDRLGKKPLCWTALPGGGVAFASQLDSLLQCRDVRRQLDLQALGGYVSLGYVPGQRTILKGVRKLAPGCTLSVRRGAAPVESRYWDLAAIWQDRPRDERPAREIGAQFAHLLDTAVADRLVSDVPLGAFLSGGLDSSTVVALMRRHQSDVTTFSIGFQEASFNELPFARRVARQLGTVHHDEVVRGDDPQLLAEIAAGQDEPFADTSIVPTYVLCRSARRRVTVALCGDGGDELLAGYVTHLADALKRGLGGVPPAAWAVARRVAGRLPSSRRKLSFGFKARQFLDGVELPDCDAHAWWRTLAGAAQVHRLVPAAALDGEAPSFAPARAAYAEAPRLGDLDRMLYVDFRTWLPDDILVKSDRAGMAHGLEVRSPFLDHRLVEFCCGLPPSLKLARGRGKQLLRRLGRGLVPRVATTRRKAGFSAPVAHWLAGPWRDLAHEALSPQALGGGGGVVDPGEARRLFDEHLAGARDHGHLLFALVMLGLWLQRVRPEAP